MLKRHFYFHGGRVAHLVLGNHHLQFHKPIARWDEALPLGNGMLGCLVWGDGAPLRFSLDRGDLWDYRVAQEVEAPTYTYARLIELVRNNDEQAIVDEFDEFYFRPSPTKLPTGRLELDFGAPADRTEYRLSLREAQAEVKLRFGTRQYVVTSFLHAEKHVGMIRVAAADGMASPDFPLPDIRIVPPAYVDEETEKTVDGLGRFENNRVSGLGYPAPEHGRDGRAVWYRQRGCDAFEYAIVYASAVDEAAGTLDIAYTVVTNAGGGN